MSAFIKWFIAFTIILQFSTIATLNTSLDDTSLQWYRASERREKFFGIGIVRFENGVCNSSSSLEGTCYTRYQCQSVSGFASGRCASNIGVCCVIQYTCGDTSPYNNTYFVNTNFPNTFNGGTRCSMIIQKCNDDICQIRIDFLSLTLAQPNADGVCVFDALTITGGGSQVPIICGENSGQHVYVDFNGNDTINIVIATSSSVSLGRSWILKVTQIGCACPTRAPSGCLMYYTSETGTVKSFNYGTTSSNALTINGTTGTRELANENYGVCIAMLPGYCSILWSQSTTDSFTVSGDTEANSDILGTQFAVVTGDQCTTDFVVIPDPYYVNGTAINSDRFCGNAFPTLVSFSKPFVLTVVTNGNEYEGVANRGFCLMFTQQRCSSLANLGVLTIP